MDQIFLSVDLEASGPCPYRNDLLSIGAVALRSTGEEIGSFEINLGPKNAEYNFDRDTKEQFWDKLDPSVLEYAMSNPQPFRQGLASFKEWVHSPEWDKKQACVFAPSLFDGLFLRASYLLVESNFSMTALDFRSFVSGSLGTSLKKSSKRNLPWKSEGVNDHRAINDARNQGHIFVQAIQHRAKLNEALLKHSECLEGLI